MLLGTVVGCEDDVPVVPVVQETFTFESGLTGWVADTAHIGLDQGGAEPVVELRSGVLGKSGDCVWMETNSPTGSAAQWLLRSWVVEPGTYDVRLEWVSGPAFGVGSAPSAIAAAAGRVPRPFDSPEGEPGNMVVVDRIGFDSIPDEPVFEAFEFDAPGLAPSSEGRIWTAVGYQAADVGEYATCVDDLSVTITAR